MLSVSVVFSPSAGVVDEVVLVLPEGATVADALQLAGFQDRYRQVALATLAISIWGAPCAPSQRLRDRDRVALCRPLQVDPKEARRRRQALQRKAKAGTRARPSR